MVDMDRLTAYLAAAAHQRPQNRQEPTEPFITISRQAGASGRSLATALLEAMKADGRPLFLGWHAFDDELCEVVATDPKLSVLADSLIDEKFRGSFEDYLARSIAGLTPQMAVFKKIFETVRGLAAGGKAIIVGRAGRHVTRDLEAGVHIRLVAPRPMRRSMVMKRYGLDEREAEKKMAALDESRRKLVKDYFSKDIDDPLLYDAVFNVGAMPIETAARMILQLAAERAERVGVLHAHS